jgi:hypothetical protein
MSLLLTILLRTVAFGLLSIVGLFLLAYAFARWMQRYEPEKWKAICRDVDRELDEEEEAKADRRRARAFEDSKR